MSVQMFAETNLSFSARPVQNMYVSDINSFVVYLKVQRVFTVKYVC